MSDLAYWAICTVGGLHLVFAIVEMLFWDPVGKQAFQAALEMDDLNFAKTRVLAENQGLYNLFLAAGLFWALSMEDPAASVRIATFFLSCVAVAGIFGYVTTKVRTLLFAQAVPAFVALIALYAISAPTGPAGT